MKYFYLAVSSVVLAYFLIILFVYFYQRNLLYHPSENNYLNDKITFNYEEIFIETDKNINLKSWFIKKDLNRFKTILIFHGNAGNLFNRVYKLNELNKLLPKSKGLLVTFLICGKALDQAPFPLKIFSGDIKCIWNQRFKN